MKFFLLTEPPTPHDLSSLLWDGKRAPHPLPSFVFELELDENHLGLKQTRKDREEDIFRPLPSFSPFFFEAHLRDLLTSPAHRAFRPKRPAKAVQVVLRRRGHRIARARRSEEET